LRELDFMKSASVSLIAAMLGLFLLGACGEDIEPGHVAPPSQVVKVTSLGEARIIKAPLTFEAVGTVKAGISSQLSSKILGNVRELKVREGDRVKPGQVLVVIDPRQVEAELHRAEASVSEAKKAWAAARSTLDAARASQRLSLATYERYLALKKESSVSDQEFDEVEGRHNQATAAVAQTEATVEAAKARIAQAEAAVASAQVGSKDAVITAPHAGIIAAKRVDVGDLATPGRPLLALETTEGFCVDVSVPENDITHVESGKPVTVRVPALQSGPLQGNVCTIVPSADPQSRSFVVKITLPKVRNLTSGLFARVEIPTGHAEKLFIPRGAVVERGQLTGIYLVDGENQARFRLVRLGRVSGEQVEVLSGMEEGDRFIVAPTPMLNDGARIEVGS
jgi:multidrug efflux pump subunit AcrA (membrane-fusion protein)